jgi:N-acetylmuramoyl-L-alanine amidase
MTKAWTRRGIIIAGSASVLLASGCRRVGQHSSVAPVNTNQSKSGTPAPQAPNKVITAGLWYEIVDGDTLNAISRKSGVSVNELVAANNLKSTLLIPHQKLWIPGATNIGIDPLAAETAPDEDEVPDAPIDPNDRAVNLPNAPGNGYVLVKRSQWTKVAPKTNARAMGKVTRLTLHHTSEHGGLVGLPDLEVIKRIENYHRNGKQWCAIGYHYLIGKDGRVYEGRPTTLQGAHVLSENENNVGISMIGDFNKKMPSARQMSALQAFLDDSRDKYRVAKNRVYGHRDLNRSICPGDALYNWLKRTYKA